MLKIRRTNQFKKDVKRLTKSGSKNMSKLKEIIIKLVNKEKLDPKFRNHPRDRTKIKKARAFLTRAFFRVSL